MVLFFTRMPKRGKMRRCSHVDRQTGERCRIKFKAPKSNVRAFCKAHKWQHNKWEKTRIVVRNNNRTIERLNKRG